MKKLLALAVVAGGVLFVIKRSKNAKAGGDVWRDVTVPTDRPFGAVSTNGTSPAHAAGAGQNN
ncbi:DLW-39 family protein [Amycolatopsis sp. GM8]|uniref:DLW-39 family protein n=1 Tax=Amycolatopsis sp. GM8 TaxID=2896530 RepID=UPI001F1B242C|nr:DLW-39 family protein [Amycolatopsis sp. GM8]